MGMFGIEGARVDSEDDELDDSTELIDDNDEDDEDVSQGTSDGEEEDSDEYEDDDDEGEEDEEEDSDEDDDDDDDDDEDEDEDEEEEEEEDDDDDDDDDDEDDDDEFEDEPARMGVTDNIVQDYGIEEVPKDEYDDIETGQNYNIHQSFEDQERAKNKKIVLVLLCCLLILGIIGGVMAAFVFGDSREDPAPLVTLTRRPTVAPTPIITPAPTTAAPTESPTATPATEVAVAVASDAYIVNGDETAFFAADDLLLVQAGAGENEAAALLNFNTTDVPDNAAINDYQVKEALLKITLPEALFQPVAIVVSLLPASVGSLETPPLVDIFDPSLAVSNKTVDLETGKTELLIDISELLFESSDAAVGRQRILQANTSEVVLGIYGTQAESIGFYSRETQFPPTLEIFLQAVTFPPSASFAPTASPAPSSSPSSSVSPSLSLTPSAAPSFLPSVMPSLSVAPSVLPSLSPSVFVPPCLICGDGNVTNPDFPLSVVVGNTTLTSCGEVDVAVQGLEVPVSQCEFLQTETAGPCCGNSIGDFFVCELCSDGGNVTNPDAIVSIGGLDAEQVGLTEQTCESFEVAAKNGAFDEVQCDQIQAVTDAICCEIGI